MLKLNLQYFGHLMWRASSLEKTVLLGEAEGRRRREWWKTRWLEGIPDSMDMSLSKLGEMVKDSKAWKAAVHGVKELYMTEWPKNKLKKRKIPKIFQEKVAPTKIKYQIDIHLNNIWTLETKHNGIIHVRCWRKRSWKQNCIFINNILL